MQVEHQFVYDVLILGGGVAGMTAAVYAKRAGKKVAIIEKFALGGQLSELGKIENFPSQTQIDGISLAQMFRKQIKALEIEVIFDEIEDADIAGEMKVLNGKLGQYSAKSLIIATGMGYNTAGIGEEEFLGRGVSYCAVCDGNFFKKHHYKNQHSFRRDQHQRASPQHYRNQCCLRQSGLQLTKRRCVQ